jgi:hypothetical protein
MLSLPQVSFSAELRVRVSPFCSHTIQVPSSRRRPAAIASHPFGTPAVPKLMPNAETGFRPVLFRYWSGHYARGDSDLIVSNGVGNWFPLRTRAPAEIIHITLRRV